MTILQIVSALAPQLASDTKLNDHITLATMLTNTTFFGDNYNLAVALRACHTLTLTNLENNSVTTGGAGSISSKSEGDLSVSFAVNSEIIKKDPDLSRTNYGIQLLGLISGNGVSISLSGCNDYNFATADYEE